jgi:carbon-monoxide dehydrogenase medium subunit
MARFEYLAPRTVAQAAEHLADYGEDAKVIAGGQSLLILIRQGLVSPGVLVCLHEIAGLGQMLHNDSDGLELGAAVTQTQIATSQLIREKFPALAQAAERVGSVHVRNLGTLGGNVCHADPAGDSPPALLALGASVRAASRRGERVIPLDGFFRDAFESVLEPDEVVMQILVPAPPPCSDSVYLKHAARSVDRATVGVSVWWEWDGEDMRCRDIRIGLTGAGPIPLRARQAESFVTGHRVTEEVMAEAGQMAARECDPLSDSHAPASYRRKMVAVFVRRALGQLVERASRSGPRSGDRR